MIDVDAENIGITELANAIIVRACQDYFDKSLHISKKSIEDFFSSEWFVVLSRGCVSGQTVIKHLRSEHELNNIASGAQIYYRVKEKAKNGEKELRWNLSESAKRWEMAKSLLIGHDAGRVGGNSES